MKRLRYMLLTRRGSFADVASRAGIAPETLSRIANGKQHPSYAEGGSAERIAKAIDWKRDVRELFEEMEVRL